MGYMVPSAGYLKYFKLYLYDEGFVIQMPVMNEPSSTSVRTAESLVPCAAGINQVGRYSGYRNSWRPERQDYKSDVNELVLVQEALQEEKIAQIAEQIKERSDVRFVLIAGPSSSSKTTFSHRLSVQAAANGLCPYPIAVDNYLKNVKRHQEMRMENLILEGLGRG